MCGGIKRRRKVDSSSFSYGALREEMAMISHAKAICAHTGGKVQGDLSEFIERNKRFEMRDKR